MNEVTNSAVTSDDLPQLNRTHRLVDFFGLLWSEIVERHVEVLQDAVTDHVGDANAFASIWFLGSVYS